MRNKNTRKVAIVILAVASASTIMLGGCGERSEELSSITSAADETYKARQILSALNYNPKELVKLPKNYMKMEITLDNDYTVSEDQTKQYVEDMLRYSPVYKESNKEEVEKGDIANIDFTGTIDGEEFDGGSATDYYIEVGSNSFIDGFEDQMIGMSVGDEEDITVTFPEDYGSEELNGKEAVFKVKINYIADDATQKYDDLTDDYVDENLSSAYGLSTVEELKDYAKEQLESENASQKNEDIRAAIMEKLLEESEFKIPEDIMEERMELVKDNISTQAKENDMEVDEFMNEYYQITLDDYLKENKESIENAFKEELVLQAMIKDLRLDVSGAEFNSYLSEHASYYGMTANEMADNLGGKKNAMLSYAENLAYNVVASSVTVQEKGKSDTKENVDKQEKDLSANDE